jgi:hypothetical protein
MRERLVFVIAASWLLPAASGAAATFSLASKIAGWMDSIPIRKKSMEKPQKFERRANPQYRTTLPQARQS